VKAFAELIHTPLYGQLRILNEQKYPNQAPGFFKVQYYRPALTVIRRYYQTGNNLAHLPTSGAAIPGVGTTPHRIDHNLRAITAFRNGNQRHRTLAIHEPQTWELVLANVTLRATPDLIITENDNKGYVLFDCREKAPETEIIRTTVELLHHTLAQNGIICPLRRVEYVHLESDTLHRWNTPRKQTTNRATQTAEAIETLWESI
jgi:hypothetical protein